MSKSTTPTRPKPPRWWVSMDDDTAGPYTASQILSQIQSGQMDGATLACLEGSEQWRTLAEWPQFQQAKSPDEAQDLPASKTTASQTEIPAFIKAFDRVERGARTIGHDGQRAIFWGVILVVAAIFFGAGPLKGCMPDGCRYKSDSQRRLEELQRRLNP